MFSNGQLIFALLFAVGFTLIVILSYRSDKKKLPNYFKGSYKILIGFFVAFSLLVLIKYLTQNEKHTSCFSWWWFGIHNTIFNWEMDSSLQKQFSLANFTCQFHRLLFNRIPVGVDSEKSNGTIRSLSICCNWFLRRTYHFFNL